MADVKPPRPTCNSLEAGGYLLCNRLQKVVCGELARVDGTQELLMCVMLVSKRLGPFFFFFKVQSDTHNFFFLAPAKKIMSAAFSRE